MAKESIPERLARLKQNMNRNKDMPKKSKVKRGWKFKERLKEYLITASIATVIGGGIVGSWLVKDYISKRQDYPLRNVLFTSKNKIDVAGGTETRGESSIDKESESRFSEGGLRGVESKVGTYFAITRRETGRDIEYFNMENTQKIRIASATKKNERVQAGLRFGGATTFKEQIAEIIGEGGTKTLQKYRVYKFVPERGTLEKEITVVENNDGSKTVENLMTEKRSWPLGWFVDKRFRAGTFLEDYPQTTINEIGFKKLEDIIKKLDSEETKNREIREKTMKQTIRLEQSMIKTPVYFSFEDGIVDLLPQESTTYLAYKPSLAERIKHWAGFGRHDKNRLRVENNWDLWPGRYPILKNWHFGKGENIFYPFDKYNNGGYTLKDKFGEIAKIEINDFLFFQGAELLLVVVLKIEFLFLPRVFFQLGVILL